MVFYRKYRPQKIADLDSETVRNSLYSIFSKSNFPHAFLFSGPKGLGKTSAARIVAKVINCEKHQDLKRAKTEKEIEPDNKCFQCTSITDGNNFDVLEIDAASNRGIDEIRDLKEKINLLPSKASKKIYIIDEVHMLTTEAFNALLKTLEEPPAHAVFILCTTELHKLPQTIVSRCFRVDFKKATTEEITRSLKRIIKTENLKINDDVLLEIAKMSEGSFRDGAKILEEMVFSAGKKTITTNLLGEKFNTIGVEKAVDELVDVFVEKDAKKGFEITAKLGLGGIDFKYFIEKVIDRFYAMLLTKIGISSEFESKFSLQEIKKILEFLSKAHQETKYSVLPQLPLELAIVEWTQDSNPAVALPKSTDSQDLPFVKKPVTTSVIHPKGNVFADDFIKEVKNYNHLIAGVLRSCEIENVDGDILEIIAISKFHKEKLEEEKSTLILQEVAEKLTGKKVKINIILRG